MNDNWKVWWWTRSNSWRAEFLDVLLGKLDTSCEPRRFALSQQTPSRKRSSSFRQGIGQVAWAVRHLFFPVPWEEKKQLVFDASIDGSSTSLGKLTEQDCGWLQKQAPGWDWMTCTWPEPCLLESVRKSRGDATGTTGCFLTRLSLEVTHPSSGFEDYIFLYAHRVRRLVLLPPTWVHLL